jgi:hypothetical protein
MVVRRWVYLQSTSSWICFQCGLPNFSTTFFETEERIEISNKFNTFNDSLAVMPISMKVDGQDG